MPASKSSSYTNETQQRAAAVYAYLQQQIRQTIMSIWQPQAGTPQVTALNSVANELFYGGAAGGGKTDLLIGAALTRHYRSIIFRREFPQLRDIITRTREIIEAADLTPKPKYNSTEHLWRNIPGKRTLEFGAIKDENNKTKYQGRAHDLKGYDEITHFTKSQYKYTSGWNRTVRKDIVARTICTGNPPMTAEGEWIIEYWAPWLDEDHPRPAVPGELRWFATIEGEDKEVESDNVVYFKGFEIRPRSRTFIPARLTDNPLLMATDYASVLQGLPEPMRSQLLFGDFSIEPDSDQWQVIPTPWIRAAQQRWRDANGVRQSGLTALGLDPSRGGKDATVVALRYDNYFEIMEFPGTATPDGPEAAKHVLEALGLDREQITLNALKDSIASKIPVNVDVIGVGASAYDFLKFIGMRAYDVHNSTPSTATDVTGKLPLLNYRAESYWRLRDALDPQYGLGLMLPPDRELAAELAAPKWSPTVRGIQVEDKVKVHERLGRSPDKADAIALSMMDMVAKRDITVPTSSTQQTFGSATPLMTIDQREVANRYGIVTAEDFMAMQLEWQQSQGEPEYEINQDYTYKKRRRLH